MWPNLMHILVMSSLVTEVASNGVPYFCVTIKRYILLLSLGSSDGTRSLPEAVAEDVVDILLFLFWGVAQHYSKY